MPPCLTASQHPQGNQMKPTRRQFLAMAGIVLAGAIGGTAWWYWQSLPRRAARAMSEVEPGILYRSGQPEGPSLQDLRDKYHIRTVICLREDVPELEWRQNEEEYCRANGIRFVPLSTAGQGFTEDQMALFLKIVQDPASQPVLLHCEHGRTRTGYAVAVYRIVVQHWTYDRAIDEAARFGFHSIEYPDFDGSLRALAAGQRPGQAPSAPTPSDATPSSAK